MLVLSIIATLVFFALWTLAWRRRPILAFGIFLGAAGVGVIAALIRPGALDHVPIWLPPLPFATVAVGLFYFGVLAWLWGRKEPS
jgi:hypothetical protein